MKQNFNFINSYGDKLKGKVWSKDDFKKIVILVTGMQEHCNRYDYLANKLNENYYQVYCLDHYGQGENVIDEKSFGIVCKDFFNKMSDSIFELYCTLKNQYDVPIYIISHSMGSFICQNMIQRHKFSTNKLILIGSSGPILGSKIGYLLARLIVNKNNFNKPSKLLKTLTIGQYEKAIKNKQTKADWLSFNKENVNKYLADKACNYQCSNGFYLYLIKGLANLFNKAKIKNIDPNLDILILSGKHDPVSKNTKTLNKLIKIYKNCGHDKINSIYYDGRHEILNEDFKDEVIKDIIEFLNK